MTTLLNPAWGVNVVVLDSLAYGQIESQECCPKLRALVESCSRPDNPITTIPRSSPLLRQNNPYILMGHWRSRYAVKGPTGVHLAGSACRAASARPRSVKYRSAPMEGSHEGLEWRQDILIRTPPLGRGTEGSATPKISGGRYLGYRSPGGQKFRLLGEHRNAGCLRVFWNETKQGKETPA